MHVGRQRDEYGQKALLYPIFKGGKVRLQPVIFMRKYSYIAARNNIR